MADTGVVNDVEELASGTARPSRRAFSFAAFSALARLSASIWARMAALALASSSLSGIHSFQQSKHHHTFHIYVCDIPLRACSAAFIASFAFISSLILFISLPAFRRIASFALFSSASFTALAARFSASLARSSSSFCFFSSSVSGLT